MTKYEVAKALEDLSEEDYLLSILRTLGSPGNNYHYDKKKLLASLNDANLDYIRSPKDSAKRIILEIGGAEDVFDSSQYASLQMAIFEADTKEQLWKSQEINLLYKFTSAIDNFHDFYSELFPAWETPNEQNDDLVFVFLNDDQSYGSTEFSKSLTNLVELLELFSHAYYLEENPEIKFIESGSDIILGVVLGATAPIILAFKQMWDYVQARPVRKAQNSAGISKAKEEEQAAEINAIKAELDFKKDIQERVVKNEITQEEADNYIARITKHIDVALSNGVVPQSIIDEGKELALEKRMLAYKKEQMLLNPASGEL